MRGPVPGYFRYRSNLVIYCFPSSWQPPAGIKWVKKHFVTKYDSFVITLSIFKLGFKSAKQFNVTLLSNFKELIYYSSGFYVSVNALNRNVWKGIWSIWYPNNGNYTMKANETDELKSGILFFYSETNKNLKKTKGTSSPWIFNADVDFFI